MADVRRSRTWEDLGFVRDRSTGLWAGTAVRAAATTPTWGDLGFVQDRSGRWVEAVRAGGHHFNPAQPRDPGGADGGRWVRAIFQEAVHTAAGSITTAADRDGTHIRFGDSESGRLDDSAVSNLADLLGEVGYNDAGKYPRVNSVHTYGPGGEHVGFAEVRQPDYQTAELELLTTDHRMPLTAAEADRLGLALVRAQSSWRVDADSGLVDVWAAGVDDAVLRTAGGDGDPVEVHLTGGDVDGLAAAVDRAASGRTGTVQTSAGPVKVRRVSAPSSEDNTDDALVEMMPADGRWWVIWRALDANVALDSLRAGLDRLEEWQAVL